MKLQKYVHAVALDFLSNYKPKIVKFLMVIGQIGQKR